MSQQIINLFNMGVVPDDLVFTAKPDETLDLAKVRYNTFYKTPEFWLHKFENPTAFTHLPGAQQILESIIENAKSPLEEILMRQECIQDNGLDQLPETTDETNDTIR